MGYPQKYYSEAERRAAAVERAKQWRLANPERYRQHMLKRRERHGEKDRAYSKAHYLANREIILAQSKERYRNDPEYRKRKDAANHNWERRNPDKALASSKAWRARNIEKCRKSSRLARVRNIEVHRARARLAQQRKRSTPQGKLSHRMSTAIRMLLKTSKAYRKWEAIVGYTAAHLERHIEAHFLPGMNWERFMRGEIHIDHVIPKSKFTYTLTDDIQFKQCWALENLSPLWASKNIQKNAKLERPAQIALGI